MKIDSLLAIIYADIFDYPLTREEMERWGITYQKSKGKNQKHHRQSGIPLWRDKSNIKNIQNKNQYYFLAGREKIVEIRIKRKRYSREKLKIAEKAARILRIIPIVKMVAISGNLAVNNCGLNDDIDFLIITKRNLLWTTRLLTTVILDLFRLRRRRNDKNLKDKICLNLFLDEGFLVLPKDQRNLYTAHEVVQLKKIWDRDNTYLRFINNNQWVKEYLPNSIRKIKGHPSISLRTRMLNVKYPAFAKASAGTQNSKLSILLENIFRTIQLWYMKQHKTSEKISRGIIMFHPEDKTGLVLKEYNRKVNKLLVNCS